jgi:hypothetical protein
MRVESMTTRLASTTRRVEAMATRLAPTTRRVEAISTRLAPDRGAPDLRFLPVALFDKKRPSEPIHEQHQLVRQARTPSVSGDLGSRLGDCRLATDD